MGARDKEPVELEVIRDPDRLEAKSLREHTDPRGAKIIEIGCGDGRLTWQYADSARAIYGIDPDLQSLRSANESRPASLKSLLSFLLSKAEALPFANNTFDLAIMAWSL